MWSGRELELKEIYRHYDTCVQSSQKGTSSQHDYPVPVVYGGLGVGKTRFVYHSFEHWIQKQMEAEPKHFTHSEQITFHFGIGGADVAPDEIAKNPKLHFGMLLASRYFFGIGCSKLSSKLMDLTIHRGWNHNNLMALFDIEKVWEEVRVSFLPGKLILALQFDEHQQIPRFPFRSLLQELSSLLFTGYKSSICLLVAFSGTNPSRVIEGGVQATIEPTASFIHPKASRLGPLTDNQAVQVLKETLQVTRNEVNSAQRAEVLGLFLNTDFGLAICSLGNYGRNLECFFEELDVWVPGSDIKKSLSDLMNRVIRRVRDVYGIDTWAYFLGKDASGPRYVCLWALTQHPVSLDKRINGITVRDAQNAGVLYLKENQSGSYTLDVPLIFLRAINQEVQPSFIPDDYLDIFQHLNPDRFEILIGVIRLMLGNLMALLNRPSATYAELYPGALGDPATLAKSISLRKLELVTVDANPATHQSLIDFDLSKVKIRGGLPVDLKQAKYLVVNVAKAPSMDLYIHHPSGQGERIQCKSSENISRGESPCVWLQCSEIYQEYSKVSNKAHSRWAGDGFTFVFISNKPLAHYEVVREQPETYLPPNTIVVCNQNFPIFCPPVFLDVLYRPMVTMKLLFDSLFQKVAGALPKPPRFPPSYSDWLKKKSQASRTDSTFTHRQHLSTGRLRFGGSVVSPQLQNRKMTTLRFATSLCSLFKKMK